MNDAAERMLAYEDLLVVEEGVHAEILGGRLVTAPAPLPRHSNAQGALRRFVGGPFHDDDGRGGPGGWWIFVEVDVALGVHDIVRPDLAGWRRERLPDPGDTRPITVTPDWVCEVLSPSTSSRDRVIKRRLYAEVGIPYYWLVDTQARSVEALSLRDGGWVELGAWDDTATAAIPPFETVPLEIDRLFLPRAE